MRDIYPAFGQPKPTGKLVSHAYKRKKPHSLQPAPDVDAGMVVKLMVGGEEVFCSVESREVKNGIVVLTLI